MDKVLRNKKVVPIQSICECQGKFHRRGDNNLGLEGEVGESGSCAGLSKHPHR